MEADRFDTLTRTAGSRRCILAAALGGLPLLGLLADATARKRRRKRPCRHIRYKLRADTCPLLRTNSCRRKKRVNCQSGKTCLANNSCGVSCAASTDCPAESGCTCSHSAPKVCLGPVTSCGEIPTRCTTTADCPLYSVCEETACGVGDTAEKRCAPLCGHAPVP
jgi:hypothetical protein